jgi:hypothetical protein
LSNAHTGRAKNSARLKRISPRGSTALVLSRDPRFAIVQRCAEPFVAPLENAFRKTITNWLSAIRGVAQNRRGRTLEQDTSIRAEFFALPVWALDNEGRGRFHGRGVSINHNGDSSKNGRHG